MLNSIAEQKTAQNMVINRIMCGGYFLGTYHNPMRKVTHDVKTDDEFINLILTRLDAANPELADICIITPCIGVYYGTKEPSFMISFDTVLSLSKSLQVLEIMTELFKDLGQESVLYRQNDGAHHLYSCETGKCLMFGQEIEFKEFNADFQGSYTDLNGIKFTMELHDV